MDRHQHLHPIEAVHNTLQGTMQRLMLMPVRGRINNTAGHMKAEAGPFRVWEASHAARMPQIGVDDGTRFQRSYTTCIADRFAIPNPTHRCFDWILLVATELHQSMLLRIKHAGLLKAHSRSLKG